MPAYFVKLFLLWNSKLLEKFVVEIYILRKSWAKGAQPSLRVGPRMYRTTVHPSLGFVVCSFLFNETYKYIKEIAWVFGTRGTAKILFKKYKHGLEKLSRIGVENLAQLWNVRLVGSEVEMGENSQACLTRWKVLLLFSKGWALQCSAT